MACTSTVHEQPGAQPDRPAGRSPADWLVTTRPFPARAGVRADGRELVLENGLVRRVWRLEPNLACVALDDLRRDTSLLRAVRPEAQLVLDGVTWDVGGLVGQPNHAYLTPDWLDAMTADPRALRYVGHELGRPRERMAWPRVRHHAPDATWPPRGVSVRFDFAAPAPVDDGGPGRSGGAPALAEARELDPAVVVSVHYELYDDVPVMSKWISVRNGSRRPLEIDRFTSEILAVVEHSNHVEYRDIPLPQPDLLHVETDYAFGGFNHLESSRFAVHWVPDPEYQTQVNYRRLNPCLLRVEPTRGPDVLLAPNDVFHSFRAFELVHDGGDRERRGLALRRMYRAVAPWVTENPLILHVVSIDEEVVERAIDQAAACGFEMVSLSFGSGLDMEDDSASNHARFRRLARYAEARGIHLGGYSLLSSRRIQPDGDNCIHPDTGEPGGQTHGFCPALASDWGQDYFRRLDAFYDGTGFLQFTHDGSYPGDVDAAARPPLQRGLDDSRWVQWSIITDFYRRLRERGVYLRVPDYYYLSGANECGMGYREVNWSLPRAQQVIHTRQNIYDGTWEKTPSMGWMFVPLTQYHGGGAAATIEPLDDHREHYGRMLDANLALGVQAVYRGHRLYDSERVRDLVRARVDWFKRHRDILESDLVHGRRADGRDLDWMLHVNPRLDTKGMLVVFNPLDQELTRTLQVNLYYTGLTDLARFHAARGVSIERAIPRDHVVAFEVTVPARGMAWYAID